MILIETAPSQTAAPESHAAAPAHNHKLLYSAAGICILAGVAALSVSRYQHAAATPQFQFAKVEMGTIESKVSATGTLNAVVSVQVGSQVSGNIKALYADFNSVVKANQLVALIDPVMFQAKVDQAAASWQNSKASLENARANEAKAIADLSAAKATEANWVAAIVKAKSAVSDASTKLERRKEMFKDQILDQEDLDTAQNTYDQAVADLHAAQAQDEAAVNNVRSAEAALKAAQTQVAMFAAQVKLNLAELKQAQIDLANTRIVSPVDGTVVSRQMDVGQTVAASFQAPQIFQIAQDLKKMQVDTNIDESDVGRLKVGQRATFSVDAYPGVEFFGPILQIRKAPINVQNVITYDAVIEANNPDLKLFPGMTANVSILTDRAEHALKVPNAALRFKPSESLLAVKASGENGHFLYVLDSDNKLHPVQVRTGISDSMYTEVFPGTLTAGTQVVVGLKAKGTLQAQTSAPGATPAAPASMRRF